MTPTEEQQAILAAVAASEQNLLVTARAGAAKTTTLVMIAEALPRAQILSLAFNRNIANEMKERLPRNCSSMTLNSLAYRALRRFFSIRNNWRADEEKCFQILKELDCPWEYMSDALKAFRLSKALGYVEGERRSLLSAEEFFAALEEEPPEDMKRIVSAGTVKSWKELQGRDRWADFGDQLLGATLLPASFDYFDVILVDEAQDLSLLNHQMLKKLARSRSRVIAVGDDLQAIYAFRGAHQDSMQRLKQQFEMEEHKLTVSFRCPQTIVNHVLALAPDMTAFKKGGEVNWLEQWTTDSIDDYTAVLCRNNAPLFRLNSELLRAGRNPEYVGHDTIEQLLRTMKKFGQHLTQAEVLREVDAWEEDKLRRSRNPENVEDLAESMRVIAQQASDLAGALSYLRSLKRASGRIKLMTVHKAKGLEFDKIYILDEGLIGFDGQEPNIRYVARTRAKQEIVNINTEGFSA